MPSYYKHLTEGVGQYQWGYGIRRTVIKADPKEPEFITKVPYAFTSAGYKDNNGDWFVCLRMNVDQDMPQKRRPMNNNTDMRKTWFEMMHEFAHEYALKNS
jgi:hypothetical protein